MKTVLKLTFFNLVLALVSLSCSNSARSDILTNISYNLSKPNSINIDNVSQRISFSDNGTLLVNGEDKYSYSWLDKNALIVKLNGKEAVLQMKFLDSGHFKVAILFKNEEVPKNESDWKILEEEQRVLELTLDEKSNSSAPFIEIDGVKIPLAKIPPKGIYIENRNSRSDFRSCLMVTVENEQLEFQTGTGFSYDEWKTINFEGELTDAPLRWIKPDGSFLLENSNYSCLYMGNGIIEFKDGSRYINHDIFSDNYQNNHSPSSKESVNLLEDYIRLADIYHFIGSEDIKDGRIVRIGNISGELTHSFPDFTSIEIPKGKMWTPLFIDQTKGDDGSYSYLQLYYVTLMDMYKSDYRFEVHKDEFVSIKFSKQNNTAFTRDDYSAIRVFTYSNYLSEFDFYCYEEDIK